MAIKIGINGFGRIGRLVFGQQLRSPTGSKSSASTILCHPDYMEYMAKYDTVHGRFQGELGHRG